MESAKEMYSKVLAAAKEYDADNYADWLNTYWTDWFDATDEDVHAEFNEIMNKDFVKTFAKMKAELDALDDAIEVYDGEENDRG
jgi:thiaminase